MFDSKFRQNLGDVLVDKRTNRWEKNMVAGN